MIHLDFESRSRVDIWEVGAYAYSVHPSTEILCLAWAKDDGPVNLIEWDDIDIGNGLEELNVFVKKGELFSAYNAFFEQCVWENILVKKYGWPRIPIKQWRCVMAKSLARGLPKSLKDCGAALNAPIQKDEKGHRMMLKLCKPNSEGNWNGDPEDLRVLYDYCINDVESERCIDNMLPDLTPAEQQIWFLDQLINRRGVYVDKFAIQKAMEFSEIYTQNSNQLVSDVSNGRLAGVSRRMEVLNWCKDKGVDIKGYTKSDVRDTLQKDIPDEVRTVLEAKLATGRTSIKKYQAMDRSSTSDGRIRDLFIYHGAATGRWSGKIVQFQNLFRGEITDPDTAIHLMKNSTFEEFSIFYPDVMAALASCLRGMVIATPGTRLFVVDYSAIEARLVMWLANEMYGLKQFFEFDQQRGEEPYKIMAKMIFNKEKITKDERFVGKQTILGCGYGMGDEKFQVTCDKLGYPIPIELATRAVNMYRATYPRVKESWYAQEAAAIRCVQIQTPVACGKITWEMDKYGDLLCRLPSGRCLTYNKPSLDYVKTPWGELKLALHYFQLRKVDEESTTTQWVNKPTYGGKLVENITQAVARDILAYAMYRAERAGYPIVLHIHDEIVAEVPAGNKKLNEFERLLCEVPKWALHAPIVAKGFETERYRKE